MPLIEWEGRLIDRDAQLRELDRADAVVLLTDHDVFDLGLVASAPGFVLDTRNTLKGTRELL